MSAMREPEPLWQRQSAAYRMALLRLATPAGPADEDVDTSGWPVPLRRHCQACSDAIGTGEPHRCERAVYCSPWWPCVPCECACGDTLARIRERQRAAGRAAAIRGGEKVVAMLGVEHLRAAARAGGLATAAQRRALRERGESEEAGA